jgi:acyl-homoserine-lactone acylase
MLHLFSQKPSFMKSIYLIACLFCFIVRLNAQINPKAVTIVRDKWGVPHIFAKTDPEVAYGLAWAHAEDDFKTIQLTLLAGKQMLGRHLGKDGAAADYVVGLIRASETVENHFKDLSPEFVALQNGYAEGLNAYAAAHPNEVLVKGSFPITLKEGLTAAVFSISIFSGLDGTLKSILDGRVAVLEQFKTKASNTFAFRSTKTTDGKTYLNINSHQPLEGPVAWYEAHLCSEQGWNILGGLFPGGSTIFHGVNENLGWAHTVNFHDKMDVFQLEINPNNKLQYRFDNQWIDLEVRNVKLHVKGIPFAIKKKAYWSKYGPTVIGKTGTFALRFAALFDIRAMEQWYKMNKAQNFSQYYNAMKMTAIPGFNTVYADRSDTIFYISNGKIPIRNPKYDWKNTLPGNTSETQWTTFHPVEALPQLINPASGYVFNTNNTPFSASGPADNLKSSNFDPTMGFEMWNNNRSTRFMELVKKYDKLSYEDFKTIKYDGQLPNPVSFLTDLTGLFELKAAQYPDLAPAIEKIQRWDKKADVNNPDAAVFMLFFNYFREKFAKSGESYFRKLTEAECVEGLRFADAHLRKYFGTLDVKLGEIQKLVRGTKELPCFGISDVITAMESRPHTNGRYKAQQGESYIALVKFSKTGLPEIETVNCYGASNHPESPHYSDQMELFVSQKTKPMTLDKATVMREAIRTYSPEKK